MRSILTVYNPTTDCHDCNTSFTLHIDYTDFTSNKAKETFGKFRISSINLSLSSHFTFSNCKFASNERFGLEFEGINHLKFHGPNKFEKNFATKYILFFNRTIPLFSRENKFSKNHASIIMHIFRYVSLLPTAKLKFGNNFASSLGGSHNTYVLYVMTDERLHPCVFQFTRPSNNLDAANVIDNNINFIGNKWYVALVFGASLNSCYWVNNCVYANTTKTPGEVYGYIIDYNYDNSNLVGRSAANVCYCRHNDGTSDCIQDSFSPILAGRTVLLNLKLIRFRLHNCCLHQLISNAS